MTIKVKRTKEVGKPVIEIIKPEDIIVSAEHEEPTLTNARFVAYRHIILQSELTQ